MENNLIFEIERFAVHDGPGIRTLIFLKGCPLRCLWCANPESQRFQRSIMYWITRCIGCGKCASVCPQGAISIDGGVKLDHDRCVCCGICAAECNANALTQVGESIDAAQILKAVDRDREFYETSGGGVTFSGGEPLSQGAVLSWLAGAVKERGYHTCIETSGYAPWPVIESQLPYLDLFLYDFKCMEPERHIQYVGVNNKLILENYVRLVRSGKQVIARMPVIPTVNDSPGQLQEMADFLQEHNPGSEIHLLPYHRLGVSKYTRLGLPYALAEMEPPTKEHMEDLLQFFKNRGFLVTLGG